MVKNRKKKKAKPKIELTPKEEDAPAEEVKPELSETPVVGGEQANAPAEPTVIPPLLPDDKIVAEATVDKKDETAPKVTTPDESTIPHGNLPKSVEEFPTIPRPEIEKGPEPAEPNNPVTCSGCKVIVDSATVRPCINPGCPKSLVYCPSCAKPGTCHKCGMKLDPDED